MKKSFFWKRHAIPAAILIVCNVIYWIKVLLSGGIYLPGKMLAGFAPFGGDSTAPWNILHWDALGQYYPWRHFAAQSLRDGIIPLWNPHQFAGAPFIANLQSAVFYPLNFPFWIFDTAHAFLITAILHTLLATFGAYFLAQHWKMTRPASLLVAIGFGFCGYLSAWFILPTLAYTACWLPLLVLLLELNADAPAEKRAVLLALFSIALACAALAGHVQIFLYLLLALLFRIFFLRNIWRGIGVFAVSGIWAFALAALQIFPTLELAKLGHRSGGAGTVQAWQQFIVPRALQWGDLPSLIAPWPFVSFNENIGYMGAAICLLAIAGIALTIKSRAREGGFALVLVLFGLLFALATPLAKFFFLYIPGVSQMGGPGRALILWSFGAAILAGIALDTFIKNESAKSTFAGNKSTFIIGAVAAITLIISLGELVNFARVTQPVAPKSAIYPATELTDWLQKNVANDERILAITPRQDWLPTEILQQNGRNHPAGVLPPNGATIYGLNDINGYDSLSPKKYRDFLVEAEGEDVSPPLNGNMILVNNLQSPALDALRVRFVITQNELPQEKVLLSRLQKAWEGDGSVIYRREINENIPRRDGKDFYPGWRNSVYQPTTFRFGLFVSLCAWCAAMMCLFSRSAKRD